MKIVQVQVELEKRVSDGNYGSVRAGAQITAGVEPGEDGLEVLRELLHQGHQRVLLELRNSENLRVRRSVNPKTRVCEECKQPLTDDEDYEHEACSEVRHERQQRERDQRDAEYRRQREEQEARWREQRELAAVGAPSDGAEEDDGAAEDDEAL